jgi:glycyl-tRNA synthetase
MITMEKLVSFCKEKGFIFAGSEIYGGLANAWDYGPVGVELKNNIKRFWWKKFVQESQNTVGVDAAILMNPRVWEASGHLASFTDPLMDCKECKARFRADNLIKEFSKGTVNTDVMDNEQMSEYIKQNNIACPLCKKHNFTPIRQFNLMFETNRGVTKESQNTIYLRPETAQGQYVNFLNVQRSLRLKVPFGIAQIGKAFRNEITPGNFTFRTIEFEQMEHQWFCKPGEDEKYYDEYKQKAYEFYKSLGFKDEHLMFHDHDKLAFYAKAACDVYYKFPFGFDEINGIHNRTNYDLTRHQEYSGKTMEYLDPVTNEKFIPYVIEASFGADRVTLATLIEAYDVETLEDGTEREIMRFAPFIAPFKVAVLPLMKKEHSEKAQELYATLSKHFRTMYDETASIGKRYRRQDSIGTPFCVTVDQETLENGTVTVRERDSMKQDVVKLENLVEYISTRVQM